MTVSYQKRIRFLSSSFFNDNWIRSKCDIVHNNSYEAERIIRNKFVHWQEKELKFETEFTISEISASILDEFFITSDYDDITHTLQKQKKINRYYYHTLPILEQNLL